ncbi:MAG: 50S ribosomal protein L19 [Nitrospinae bacterium RIFCSPLOWO2_12_FULL_47_7]|nr:MAG: 50S ribosomal protein L19 [Nitrospinae bacterium RIFCSPLOWO2_12_FULL_47_7]
MNLIQQIEAQQMKKDLPRIAVGDTVNVHMKIREGEKERIQSLEGLVIRISNTGVGKTVTVRKISFGVGVERIFPLHSPLVEKIDIIKHARVRKAKLYYIRELKGKAARLKESKKTPAGKKKRAKADAGKPA